MPSLSDDFLPSIPNDTLSEDLLPGIPNCITLNHIASNLPWIALHVLSSVSWSWRRAMQSRQVFDARVRSHSTEKLVVIKHEESRGMTAISLYSMREKAFYKLPPIPYLQNGIPWFSQFISSDGKLYVLGHAKEKHWPSNWSIDKQDIYVLDLAGQRQWKESASIPEPVKSKLKIRCAMKVLDDLYVRVGYAKWFSSAWHVFDGTDEFTGVSPLKFLFLDSQYGRQKGKLFMVKGKFYCVRTCGIYASNDAKSWTHKHSKISCDELGPIDSVRIEPLFILPVNNELFSIVRWYLIRNDDEITEDSPLLLEYCVLQSRGFGTESKDLLWQKIPFHFCFDELTALAMCPIQL